MEFSAFFIGTKNPFNVLLMKGSLRVFLQTKQFIRRNIEQ